MRIERTAAPLRMQAASYLRQAIVSGKYSPGERLIERHLEEELQVSRTVVREALRQLESERLIFVKPNVGPVVAILTYDDALHLYQARSALESAAARHAAINATDDDVDNLRSLAEQLRVLASGDAPDILETVALKNRFYDDLLTISRNPVLKELLDNIQARISFLRGITLGHAGRLPESFAEISAVIDAIESHDPDLAEAQTRHHVRQAQNLALDFILSKPTFPNTPTTRSK